jgi:hypothetical protein
MEHLRVGVLEEDEVYRRGVMAVLNEDDCVCIDLGDDREMSPEAADAEDSLDVVVMCSRSLNERRFTCPVVVLATPELAGQEKGRAASTVMATLPHEGLTSQQLLAGVRAAAAGLQVESPSLSSEPIGGAAPGPEAQRPGPLVHLAPSPFRRLSGGQAGGWDIRRGRG